MSKSMVPFFGFVVIVFMTSIGLVGCGFLFGDDGHFRNRSMDYLQAKPEKEMQLPKNMKTTKTPQLYPIPNVESVGGYKPRESKDVPRPESVLSIFKDGSIQVKRDSSGDWVWVRRSKAESIELVEAFWRENRIAIDKKDMEKGIIETVWVHKTEGQAGENLWEKSVSGWKKITRFNRPLEKFKVQVVATDSHESKIQLGHASAVAKKGGGEPTSGEKVEWVASSEDDDFHELVLQQLVDYLGSEKNQRVSSPSLAQGVSSLTRVVMLKDGNGYPLLVIEQDFNRAWETVGDSLKKGKLLVEDLNRSLSTYYVGFAVKEASNKKVFEVKLTQGENGIHIAVQQDDETLAPMPVAEEILSIIKSNAT